MVAFFQVQASGSAQVITLSGKNLSLKEVFTAIEKQTNFVVFYNKQLLTGTKPVSIAVSHKPLNEVLTEVLKDQPLTYFIKDKTIILSAKTEVPRKSEIANEPALTDEVLRITIRVTDPQGRPLAGASLSNKKTRTTGMTDGNGTYSLNASPGDVIEISYVGFVTQTVIIKDNTEALTITLIPLESSLSEVQIVNKGYYTESRRLSTGSVGKVTAQDIEKQPVSNPLQAIYAKVPGVVVTQQSGMSDGAINIRIRGQNSLRNNSADNGNYPLYIIDGVPFSSTPLTTNAGVTLYPQGNFARGASPFNSLNPADIEAIEILKDADATAIYGSRGANGVILITTKKGKAGAMKVDANFYTGAGEVTRRMKLLNTRQYLEMRREAFKNDGITTMPSWAYDVNGTWGETSDHDWQEELLGGTAQALDAQLAFSGGSTTSQYRFGGGYHRETAVFPGDFANQRGSGHVSLSNNSLNNKFRSQVSVNYSISSANMLSEDPTSLALTMSPNMPDLIDKNGGLLWPTGVFSNPYSFTKIPYKYRLANFISNANLSYEILTGLIIKANLGFTSTIMKEIRKTPVSTYAPILQPFFTHSSNWGNSTYSSWLIEPQITYSRAFNKHTVSLLGGMSFQNEERDQLFQTATGFSSEDLMDNISAVPNTNVFNEYSSAQYRYQAVLARLNYNYADKYILNLTGRRDGSSRFGPGRQFANFGSIGAAWLFSEENFIKNAVPFLNYGKLRSSYGLTGNDQIPNYGYLDTYTTNGAGQYQGVSGLAPSRLLNEDFRWETNKKFEVALESGVLNNRLSFNVVYFRNRSSSQLVGYKLPPTAGFNSIQYNLPATVQNSGVEFEVLSRNFTTQHFSWSTSFNISFPKNKLIEYPNLEGSSYATTYVIGQPVNILRRYQLQGVDPQTGLYTALDADNNNIYNTADYVMNSFTGQRFYGGLQNSIQFKNFSLDFLFQFVKQQGRNYLTSFLNMPGAQSNQPVEVLDRWQKPGDVTHIQKFSTSAYNSYDLFTGSDASVSDASFIRLKNLNVAYRFPQKFLDRTRLKNLRVYVQGQNLMTITKYKGLDPETQNAALPPLRFFTGGVQIGL